MSVLRLASVVLLALALGACARMPGGGLRFPGTGPDSGAELVFIDRLAVASAAQLDDIGAELRAELGDAPEATASLRYALWLATPGHPAYDPQAAQRRLQALMVDEPRLERDMLALVRLQLRFLRQRVDLAEENERLGSENERLREQIKALTALEEEMGRSGEEQE